MIYQVFNGHTLPTYFDSATNSNAKAEAQALLITNQQTFLQNRIQSFHIAKIIHNGIGEVWLTANPNTDSNEGDYQAFNHITGLYEVASNLAAAVEIQETRKQELLVATKINQVWELNEMPPQPTIGTQEL
jgi:hypothetical protein